MSKGSKPRPVDRKKYDRNFDAIRWRSGFEAWQRGEYGAEAYGGRKGKREGKQ